MSDKKKIMLIGDVHYEQEENEIVVHVDADSFNEPEKSVDFVICTSLPEISRSNVMSFLEKVHKALKPDGIITFQVPSAEFAAKLVLTNEFNSHVMFMLYGSSKRPFRVCYTMAALRAIIESAGFTTLSATDNIIRLASGEDVIEIPVHTLIARQK